MKPYYQDDACTIYHADCREMPWPGFRCLLTDPPYGASYRSNNRADRFEFIAGDTSSVMFDWLKHAVDAQDEDGPAFVFANEDTLGAAREALADSQYRIQRTIVWDKGHMSQGDLENFGVQTEFIVYGTNRHGRAALKGPRTSNLLQVPRVASRVLVHPAEKPLALLSFLVLRSTGWGETVCDPFMGSGTTLRAAKDLGRKAIGIEVEERYCEIAAQRLAQQVLAL